MLSLTSSNYFMGAHCFTLPTQGNIYSAVNLPLVNGKNKLLVATLKRKVYSCEFLEENLSVIPVVREVPFTYIPSGAEIISIDAFNRSSSYDDFFVGITIIKANADQTTETYLNVYTQQEIDERTELNLDSLAQNCLIIELPFIPYQLYHTLLIDFSKSNEIVWLLSGSDLKMHLFREDPLNHTYCETDAEDLFPEFARLPSIIIWVDMKHTSDNQRRLTAFGCECGTVKFCFVDIFTKTILMNLSKHFDAPVSQVLLFGMKEKTALSNSKYFGNLACKVSEPEISNQCNLLVINTLQASVVFMNITEEQFNSAFPLPESEKYDSTLCGCVADINMDFKMEILIGTYAKTLLVYVYEDGIWQLNTQHKFPHAVHSVSYIDLTGDGVRELLVVTMLGVNIFQHNLITTMEKFKKRLFTLQNAFKV